MDYKFIADNDPGGDLQSAFNVMSTEMTDSTEKKLITDSMLAREIGLVDANAVMDGIERAVSEGVLPQRVVRWIETQGIDINFQDTRDTLLFLQQGDYITEDLRLKVLTLSKVPKYQGITLADIEKARLLRAQGKV